jgi:hypothetical protein
MEDNEVIVYQKEGVSNDRPTEDEEIQILAQIHFKSLAIG